MSAVFDTNIIVAAFVSEGVCSKLLRRGRNRQFSLVTCPFILHEFQQILARKFKATQKEIQEAMQLIRQVVLIMSNGSFDNNLLTCFGISDCLERLQ